MYTFKLEDSDLDSDKTLRDVANTLTLLTLAAALGLVLMMVFDPQEMMFGFGALLAAVTLFAILLEVRGALAPIRIPMEVLQNLEPEPEPQSQLKLPTVQQKKKLFQLIVNNR